MYIPQRNKCRSPFEQGGKPNCFQKKKPKGWENDQQPATAGADDVVGLVGLDCHQNERAQEGGVGRSCCSGIFIGDSLRRMWVRISSQKSVEKAASNQESKQTIQTIQTIRRADRRVGQKIGSREIEGRPKVRKG